MPVKRRVSLSHRFLRLRRDRLTSMAALRTAKYSQAGQFFTALMSARGGQSLSQTSCSTSSISRVWPNTKNATPRANRSYLSITCDKTAALPSAVESTAASALPHCSRSRIRSPALHARFLSKFLKIQFPFSKNRRLLVWQRAAPLIGLHSSSCMARQCARYAKLLAAAIPNPRRACPAGKTCRNARRALVWQPCRPSRPGCRDVVHTLTPERWQLFSPLSVQPYEPARDSTSELSLSVSLQACRFVAY